MTHTYDDGTTIEIGHGDSYPPGHVGQHTNCSRPWVRKGGGPWLRTDARSDHAVREWVLAAGTADEALEVICPGWPPAAAAVEQGT